MGKNIGKWNMTIGLYTMGAFMAYGFLLIYLRDFAPNKELWIAQYNITPHFEARLAHVHGNLFAFLNIVFGYLLFHLPIPASQAKSISLFALGGILMPIGILMEIYLQFSPIFVLIGAVSIIIATVLLGIFISKIQPSGINE